MPLEMEAARLSGTLDTIATCHLADPEAVSRLSFRPTPYWHRLLTGRHIGVHKPDDSMCNWTARVLTKGKKYRQKCLGPAIDLGRGKVSFDTAIERAFDWFESAEVRQMANAPRSTGRTTSVNFCPIGETYTVGHALRDYTEWTRIARSAGGHYNNLILINHHLASRFSGIPLSEYGSTHLTELAVQVLETPPKFGFSRATGKRVAMDSLHTEELRKRKRTFNSLVTILRMAFRHAHDNGQIETDRPLRCLRRVSVNHSARTIFLDRSECLRLLNACTPALKRLVLAALYSGCRVGELGSLLVEDVGRQGFGLRVNAFKRGPARFVFLPDEGMAFFLSCCDGKSDHDRVLLSDMGKPWGRQHTALFRRAVAMASLPREFVFHGLRHTYASDLVRSGVPLEVVARQLGHANTITVSNTYGHLVEQYREEQIRSRFTPLSVEQQVNAKERELQLKAVWQASQPALWRDYAAMEAQNTMPRKSFSRAPGAVIEIFERAGPNARR